MKVGASSISKVARAGQFIHIVPRSEHVFDPLLRRAFSIAAMDEDALEILYRVEGRGTQQLAHLRAGDTIDILGPLGTPFTCGTQHAILVGGGIGVPPLAMLAAQEQRVTKSSNATPSTNTMLDNESAGKDASDRPSTQDPGSAVSQILEMEAFIGAQSHRELICLDDFERWQVPVQIATDDGSAGLHGLVTDLLQRRLTQMSVANAFNNAAGSLTVYACGPMAMLKAVALICASFNVPCQVSLEENMPCGVGVCNGCVVRAAIAADDYGQYKRICVEGPVMWAHDIVW